VAVTAGTSGSSSATIPGIREAFDSFLVPKIVELRAKISAFSRGLFHCFPQAERPHVGPNFLDIGQTFQGIEGDWEYLRSL